MPQAQHVWGLILAGGEGSRLRALTLQPCGTAVPKQFCSLHGGRSLLEDALERALGVIAPERLSTIVAEQHRQWWSECRLLTALPQRNLIVQPRNRGTAIGILYSLAHILARDPQARLVLLPADHYVRDEAVLRCALVQALEQVARAPERPVLLGLTPDEPDIELGYILPGDVDPSGGYSVARFIEKPGYSVASEIIAAGGLWNTFIMVAAGQALRQLFLPRFAALVMEMQVLVRQRLAAASPTGGWPAILDLYERLPGLDFSRDLLQGREAGLCAHRVPPCGWSDLGTPRRVGEALRRWQLREHVPPEAPRGAYVNLAAQHARLERGQQPLASGH